jgi:hypothetical protein
MSAGISPAATVCINYAVMTSIRGTIMRAFILASVAAIVIAVGVAAILDYFVQETVSDAFAVPGVRISPDSRV